MLEWLLSMGYIGAFFGVIVEGELLLLSAIQTAHLGYTNYHGILAAAFLGALTGDWFLFLTGRKRGQAYINNRPALKSKLQRADQLMQRYSTILLIFYRFMYGFRVVMPLTFGLSTIPVLRFAFFSLLSTTLWIGTVAYFSQFLMQWFGLV